MFFAETGFSIQFAESGCRKLDFVFFRKVAESGYQSQVNVFSQSRGVGVPEPGFCVFSQSRGAGDWIWIFF